MSMENVDVRVVGVDENVIYLANQARLGLIAATNVTATTMPVVTPLTGGVNVSPDLLERAVKNSVPKAIGERIVIVLVNVQIHILYVIQFMGVFAVLDLQVRTI